MNIDIIEVNKFNSLSHKWWSKKGELKTLHQINPLRINFIQNYVGNFNKLKILDVGCGGGILTESLAQQGAEVTGIDAAKNLIKIAKLHALKYKYQINYQCTTVEKFSNIESQSYDVISCMEMLEHVPNPKSIIGAISKLVKSGGWVFFSTLNRNFKSYIFSIILAEYVLKIIPKGTHKYEKFIKPYELIRAAEKYYLTPISLKGVRYNPITQNFSISRNININYIVALKMNF